MVIDVIDFCSIYHVVVTAWYNTEAIHTAPESVNLVGNALIRATTGNAAAYVPPLLGTMSHMTSSFVKTYNAPLPKSTADQVDELRESDTGFNVALFSMYGSVFLMTSFALFVTTVGKAVLVATVDTASPRSG